VTFVLSVAGNVIEINKLHIEDFRKSWIVRQISLSVWWRKRCYREREELKRK